MLTIDIPGRERLTLNTLLLDYNGTIAADGRLIPEAAARIGKLRESLRILILTADTFGTVAEECRELGVEIQTFPHDGASVCKKEIAMKAGPGVVCLGNGWNDIGMFDEADLSIAVIDREGMCASLLAHADVLVTSPADGMDLLLHTDRLRATLRT